MPGAVPGAGVLFGQAPSENSGNAASAGSSGGGSDTWKWQAGIGGALCLTGIGAIIGLPLIIFALVTRNSSPKAGKDGVGGNLVLRKFAHLFRPVAIRVSPAAINLPPELMQNGAPASIPIGDVHRLVTRNYVLDEEGYVTRSVGGSGVAAGGAMLGMQYRAKVAEEVGWGVDVETGGRRFTLAFGLNKVTADGLMEDIRRAVNL